MAETGIDFNDIEDFISNFKGGTRVNRFTVTGSLLPRVGVTPAPTTTTMTQYHIRSASMPGSYINPISVNWRGRSVNFVGDRAYEPWQIVILDDTGGSNVIYNGFHEWHRSINDHETNQSANNQVLTPLPSNGYSTTDWIVKQLEPNGYGYIRQFKLKNCWPVAIGPLQLDMTQDNTIAAFAVTMRYTHYETDFTAATA